MIIDSLIVGHVINIFCIRNIDKVNCPTCIGEYWEDVLVKSNLNFAPYLLYPVEEDCGLGVTDLKSLRVMEQGQE